MKWWECPSRCKASSRILPDGRRLVMATELGRYPAGAYHLSCPDCPYETLTIRMLVEQSRLIRDEDRQRLLVK